MSTRSTTWPTPFEWSLIVGAWTTVAVLTAVNEVLAPHRGRSVAWTELPGVMGEELFEYAFWIALTPVVFWLVRTLPVERGRAVRNGVIHAAAAVVLAITVDATDSLLRNALFPDARGGSFSLARIITRLWFVNELVVYGIVLAAGFARDYHLQKKARQEEAERLQARTQVLEKELTEARLEALRMQLNPHFLFNTLHAVSTLVGSDPAGVRRMIARLSELLRRVLDDDAPQEVPLRDEVDVLEDYLEIQQIRFQGRLEVEIHIPPALHDAQVPYLILQPLVENAVKHGAARVRGTGRIAIHAHRTDPDGPDASDTPDAEPRLELTVRDNGPGLADDASAGVGLRNVRDRLQGLYGEGATLTVTAPNDGPGTRATLRLPYRPIAAPGTLAVAEYR